MIKNIQRHTKFRAGSKGARKKAPWKIAPRKITRGKMPSPKKINK